MLRCIPYQSLSLFLKTICFNCGDIESLMHILSCDNFYPVPIMLCFYVHQLAGIRINVTKSNRKFIHHYNINYIWEILKMSLCASCLIRSFVPTRCENLYGWNHRKKSEIKWKQPSNLMHFVHFVDTIYLTITISLLWWMRERARQSEWGWDQASK